MSKSNSADQAQAQSSQWQKQFADMTQNQIGTYNQSLNALEAKGNPWADPTYKTNENLLISGAAGSANNAANQQLRDASRASGGQNSAAYGATVSDLSRQRAQQQTQATAGQYATDYQNWINYQQWLQNAKLAPVTGENAAFSTSTTGQNGALNAQNQANQVGNELWSSVIGGVTGGLGSAFAGKA